MQQKIIVFRDYGNVEVSLFQAEDSVNIPKTILDAAKEALEAQKNAAGVLPCQTSRKIT